MRPLTRLEQASQFQPKLTRCTGMSMEERMIMEHSKKKNPHLRPRSSRLQRRPRKRSKHKLRLLIFPMNQLKNQLKSNTRNQRLQKKLQISKYQVNLKQLMKTNLKKSLIKMRMFGVEEAVAVDESHSAIQNFIHLYLQTKTKTFKQAILLFKWQTIQTFYSFVFVFSLNILNFILLLHLPLHVSFPNLLRYIFIYYITHLIYY